MPCYVTGTAEGDARLAATEAREELTQITRLLCSLCTQIEESGNPSTQRLLNDKNLAAWWKRHKRIDARRINRERTVSTRNRD